MARFKYMGEGLAFLQNQGPCKQILIPLKNGTTMVVEAVDQVNGFAVGSDIGVDITDERALKAMRVDTRFEEI